MPDWRWEKELAGMENHLAGRSPEEVAADELRAADVIGLVPCPVGRCGAGRGETCRHESRRLDSILTDQWAHWERRLAAVQK